MENKPITVFCIEKICGHQRFTVSTRDIERIRKDYPENPVMPKRCQPCRDRRRRDVLHIAVDAE